MLTESDIKQLICQGAKPKTTVTRTDGTSYSVLVEIDQQTPAVPIAHPGTEEVLKSDTIDEVASFLSQINLQQFQVTM